MNCPKCNKPMQIMVRPKADILPSGDEYVVVLGRCWDCDFDGTWSITTDENDCVVEGNLERYFFG